MNATALKLADAEFKRAMVRSLGGAEALRDVDEPRLLEPLPASAEEFVKQCAWTSDPQAHQWGRALEAPLPAKAHLIYLLALIERQAFVALEKSGQIMVSWLITAWALHDALTHRGRLGAWFCLKRETASDHLANRMFVMYKLIPKRYAVPYATMKGGNFVVYHDGPDSAPTSRILAMAQETSVADEAANKMRSWSWTWAVVDEASFTRKLRELITSLQPRCGRIVMPTTPNGMTYHHQIMYGETLNDGDLRLIAPPFATPLRGVKVWERFGWTCVDIGYEADPDKDPQTDAGRRWWNHPNILVARGDSRKWRREMERDATVPAGEPVFTDTERIIREAAVYRPALPTYCGWDNSYLWQVAVILQLECIEDAWHVHALRELYMQNSEVRPFGRHIQTERAKTCPGADWRDWGDYAENTHTLTGVAAAELGKLGLSIRSTRTGAGGVNKRVGLIQSIISDGRFHIDPETCPMLLRAMTSEWTRETRAPGDPLDVHPWKDFVDPVGYVLTGVFEVDPPQGHGGGLVLRMRDVFQGSAGTGTGRSRAHRPVYTDSVEAAEFARPGAAYE